MDEHLCDEFPTQNMKQGDALSPLLFISFLRMLVRYSVTPIIQRGGLEQMFGGLVIRPGIGTDAIKEVALEDNLEKSCFTCNFKTEIVL